MILKQEKHNVLSFECGIKALEAIKLTPFDFILTDIQMPKMDGFSFIQQLKENITTTYKNQPIIALTGRTDLDLSVYASAGFTTVIKKPYSPKVLLKTIENILNNDTMTTIEYVEKKIEERLPNPIP